MPEPYPFIIVGAFAALLQILGHWIPWRKHLGHDLPRLWAYTYGVAAMIAPLLVALWWLDYHYPFWLIIVAAGASGVGTIIGYAIDDAIERRHKLADLQDALDAERKLHR